MKANRFVALLAGALLAAGCGTGTAIFNVDIFSFLKSANRDTVSYVAPLSVTIPPQSVTVLPAGVGSSIVDSAHVTGVVAFINTSTGTGNVTFSVYIDTSSSTLYSNPPALTVSGAVSGVGDSVSSPFNIDLPATIQQFFTSTQVYVGLRAAATATVAPVQGRARLTALGLRVVLQDKLF